LKETLLITGWSGFIGRNLIQAMEKKLEFSKRYNIILTGRQLGHEFKNSDTINVIDFDKLDHQNLEKFNITAIIHLAAKVDYFAKKIEMQDNLRNTKKLIDLANRIKVKKFIFASTLGAIERSRWDDLQNPITINSKSHATSEYGKVKYLEELELVSSGLDYLIIRLPWVVGSGMSEKHHVKRLMKWSRFYPILRVFNFPGSVSMISVRNLSNFICYLINESNNETKEIIHTSDAVIDFNYIFDFDKQKIQNIIIKLLKNRIKMPVRLVYKLRGIFRFDVRCLFLPILWTNSSKCYTDFLNSSAFIFDIEEEFRQIEKEIV
jgi:nucleoside-diphosphate-sugar epimerase